MSDSLLALHGGQPVISAPLRRFDSIGEEEVAAVSEVLRSGVLSAYIGAPGENFMGGPKVRQFEEMAAQYFGVKYAVAVNSWTSGLIAMVGAIGIEPGDEIITTPWTMAACATAILHWNGIPVFADINPDTFNIDPNSVEQLITSRTKAILAVDIFGQSADMFALRALADKYGLKLLSDAAQAPGAHINGDFCGTLADIGGFSLNYHKHVHCGEGGVMVTNNDWLADRVRMIRNHGEAVISTDEPSQLSNMLGYNFRMGEIEAAIASLQLPKLEKRVKSRQRVAQELNEGLSSLPGLKVPTVFPGATHAYYVYGLTLDTQIFAKNREWIAQALIAEGVPSLFAGYQNLHLLPMFRNKIAYGANGFPWNSPYCSGEVNYELGICPVAEKLHHETFIGINLCMNELPSEDVISIIEAFKKVWMHLV